MVECLEDRLAPAGDTLATATALTFDADQRALFASTLTAANQVEILAVSLSAGDQLTVDLDAANLGSALDGGLRVFDGGGRQLARNDNADGLDPRILLAIATSGTYYVGVSSSANFDYLPTVAGSGSAGTSAGNYRLTVTRLANTGLETEPNDTMDSAQTITGSTNLLGSLGNEDVDNFKFTATATGRWTVAVIPLDPSVLDPRLQLYDDQGQLLIQADDFTPSQQAAELAQHLLPGTYYLAVAAEPGRTFLAGDRRYVFTSVFEPAPEAFSSMPVGTPPAALAQGDFNGDGRLDLVTLNGYRGEVAVWLGLGDGTFAPARRLALRDVNSVAVGDFNDDGRLDLATGNHWEGVSLMLGRGDGTFAPKILHPGLSGSRVDWVADFNGDGRLDLTAGGWMLLGQGDGTFAPAIFGGWSGVAVAAADFNGDGLLDVVATDWSSNSPNSVSVLLGRGDGTFTPPVHFGVGADPGAVVVGDFNGDGRLDLATAHQNSNYLAVLPGGGDGTFAPQIQVALGWSPSVVRVGDFNGDGRLDLATTGLILLGRGDGTFPPEAQIALAGNPDLVADVNGDGRLDLASAHATGDSPGSVSVLLGRGDGSFFSQARLGVGGNPHALAPGDFNGDGRLDLATANWFSNDVAVLLGRGDGTFAPAGRYAAGLAPLVVVAGDFNGDGRLDLATDGSGRYGVAVLLGRGDGTFLPPNLFAWGTVYQAFTLGDFNDDGHLDLAGTYDPYDSRVSLLLGRGDGSFAPALEYPILGQDPRALAVGDLNGDGRLDLVTGNSNTHDFSVLLGQGNGTFAPETRLAVGSVWSSSWVTLEDFNHDGRLDLASADLNSGDVAVLLGQGDGTFAPGNRLALGAYPPSSGTAGDLNGDGHLDLAVAIPGANTVSALLGRGDGTFAPPTSWAVGASPNAVREGDFNGDGRLDLAAVNVGSNDVSVLLNSTSPGAPQLLLQNSAPAKGVENLNVPLYQDFNQDGLTDLLIVNRAGEILFRQGLVASSFLFASPVVVNPGLPVRDLSAVSAGPGQVLIAAAARAGATVSIYSWDPATRALARTASLATGMLPVRVASADLDGNGLDDLAVASALDNQVTIALQVHSGQFVTQASPTVGASPSHLSFADVDGQQGLDIIVSGQSSGDVSVLFNDLRHTFANQSRYRANVGLYGVENVSNLGSLARSLQETVAAASADFTGDGVPDLVALNRGAHNFMLLPGKGQGAFPNPQSNHAHPTSARPTQLASADFNRDGRSDVAVLMQDVGELWVYLGNGHGTFAQPLATNAGQGARGFAVADVNGDGFLDILAGNEFGDVLLLRGDGSGRFSIERPQNVTLAVTDLNGDGAADVVLANQKLDRLSVVYRQPSTTQFKDPLTVDSADQPLLAPAALQLTDLDGDGLADLVVANSLGNNVLVYRGQPGGQFDTPVSFDVGCNPVALTVQDLDGDGDLDLAVPNMGSNDVSILLGQISGGTWSATPGPRLSAGGSSPLDVMVHDQNRDGILDLLVTSSDGKVVALPGIGFGGVGTGFFSDVNPPFVDLGSGITRTAGSTLVTDLGAVVQFDASAFAFRLLYSGRPVYAVDNLGAGFVAAFQDGTFGVLELGADGLLDLTGEFAGFVDQVSALEVLQNGTSFEVYVTQRGSDIPIILAGGDFIPVLEALPAGPLVALCTPLPGVEVALVATLVFGPLVELGAAGADPGSKPQIAAEDLFSVPTSPAQVEVGPEGLEEDTEDLARRAREQPEEGAHARRQIAPPWEIFLLELDDLYLRLHDGPTPEEDGDGDADRWLLGPAMTRSDPTPGSAVPASGPTAREPAPTGRWPMAESRSPMGRLSARPAGRDQDTASPTTEAEVTPAALAAVFAALGEEWAADAMVGPLANLPTAPDVGLVLLPALLLHRQPQPRPARRNTLLNYGGPCGHLDKPAEPHW